MQMTSVPPDDQNSITAKQRKLARSIFVRPRPTANHPNAGADGGGDFNRFGLGLDGRATVRKNAEAAWSRRGGSGCLVQQLLP